MAVVGSSKLTENEERDARQWCGLKFNELRVDYGIMNVTIISGGAKGIDTIAKEVAIEIGLGFEPFKPDVEQWEDDGKKIGYRTRNIKIAERCDILYCLPCNFKGKPCKHCGTSEHQNSGGCWTLKQAKKLKKQTFLIPPIIR